MTNQDEEDARRVKALALLAIMDRNARFVGMPPLAGKRGVAALEVFRLRDWAALAKQNGINPPGKAVVAMVLRMVEERGERPTVQPPRQLALRKTTPAPFPAAKQRTG